jgi:hypothetical protein
MDNDRYVRPSTTTSFTNYHLPPGSSVEPKAKVMMRPPPSPPRSSETSSNDATNTSTNNKHNNNSPSKQPSATTSSQSAAPPSNDNEGVTRHAYSTEQMDRARVIAAAQDEVNVGIMAVGLAWAQRQREGRRRQYLRNQAERQLRKIADAEKGPVRQQHRSGLSENPTFQNFSNNLKTGQTKTTTNTDPYDDDDQDAGDSSRIQFGTPQLSKSGEGVSGRLQIADMEEEEMWTPKVRVEEEPDCKPSYILNADLMQQIAIHVLPKTVSYQRWKRLYGLERDGDSFGACLRIIDNIAPTLLVVKTTRGDVFGGYADSPWHSQDLGSNRFYGGAQACLFKIVSGDADNNDRIKVFRWSGANRYIQLCDRTRKMIAFGGGGAHGAFGLCVEEDFLKGSTGSCDTFDNEPLCDQENFEIMDLEFWGFMAGVF